MTEDQARKLGSFVLDSGLDAQILTLGRGDEFCVRIVQPQWHCFSFEDWNEFAREQKKRRHKQRRDERPAIDARESYTLRVPALV